jgi:GDP-L-fucose synthase
VKILVTGGTGMVGQNILESEQFKKYELIAPNRSQLNLFNYQDVHSYVSKLKPDFIIHAAGRVGGIQANMAHPVEFLVENLDINRNVIMAAKNAEVKNLINLGTSCMYPRNAPNPLTEDMILKGELEPTNEGYAIAKVTAQRLCSYIHKENKEFQYKTILPCNLYGRHDKFDPAHSHLVPAVIRKLHDAKQAGLSEIDIWGDGTARREFMYAGDLVDALAMAISRFETLPELMNVGVGTDHSVNAYYEAAAEVIGYTGKFKHDLTKPVGMKQKLTSVKLAHEWGWKSQTSLSDGIFKTYQYYLNLKQ